MVDRDALAWDVATGSGQAAVELAARFDRVVATDASAAQLASAEARPNVTYLHEPAERSSLDDASADLVTVAQALHWFDHRAFFAEAGFTSADPVDLREVPRAPRVRSPARVWRASVEEEV